MVNTTLVVSPNDSNHGDPNLFCRHAKWPDVVIFFLGNYIAHAATITTFPGETWRDVALATVRALLFPVSGVIRGVCAIQNLAIFGRNDLEKAARARALAMIVKQDTPGDVPSSTKVHGAYQLPEGYALNFVPKHASFKPTGNLEKPSEISCSYNLVKVLAAIGQIIFAATNLYQARGDQIDRYGYASFGLTVTPYIFMSVVNLLGNLVCPTYPTIYIVRSKGLFHPDEVDGIVGEIENIPPARRRIPFYVSIAINWVIAAVCAATPIAIIGGMSSFQSGSSTLPQRVWAMTWLALGSSFVIVVDTTKHILDARRHYLDSKREYRYTLTTLVSLFEKIIRELKNAEQRFRDAKPDSDAIQQEPNQQTSSAAAAAAWKLQSDEIVITAKELVNELEEMSGERAKEPESDEPARSESDEFDRLESNESIREKTIRDLEGLIANLETTQDQDALSKIWDIMKEGFMLSTRDRTEPVGLESLRNSMSKHKRDLKDVSPFQYRENDFYLWLGLVVVCGAPAIGGFVVVGQMIIDYGVCIRIT